MVLDHLQHSLSRIYHYYKRFYFEGGLHGLSSFLLWWGEFFLTWYFILLIFLEIILCFHSIGEGFFSFSPFVRDIFIHG